jgi:hypothetical protein
LNGDSGGISKAKRGKETRIEFSHERKIKKREEGMIPNEE